MLEKEFDLGPEGKLKLSLGESFKLDLEHKGANGGTEMISISEPLAPVLMPLVKPLFDKFEQLVPGDQTELEAKVLAAIENFLKP